MLSLSDIKDAKESIGDLVKRTPLIRSKFLSEICGGEVYLKLENQQITNSFKIRGAFNKMLHLTAEERKRGIVTASTGNHAKAIAVGAEKLNIPAKIVIAKNTSKVKIDKIKKHNVGLLLYGNIYDEAEQKAVDLSEEEGLIYISPYADRLVNAGQGTIGLEILEDLPNVDTVIVPVGGGGLISGISIAMKGVKPKVEIVGVQSEASPVMYESLKAGRIVDINLRESIADGLFGGIEKGAITLRIVQTHVDDLLLVKEKSIRKAIYLLWEKEGQMVEGAGGVAVAIIIEDPDRFKGKSVAAVISGGDIEKKLFRDILSSETDELRFQR